MRIAVGSVVVIHQSFVPEALRYIESLLTQLIRDFSSLVVLADGVGAGGEQTIDRVLFVLLLLPHHGAVLPAGHAGILGRNAIAVFRHMAVGGEKVCSAAAAPAGRMAVLQSVHQIKDVEADGMIKEIPVHKYGFLFLFRVSGKDIRGSQVWCDGEWLNIRYGYMKDPADPKRHMVPDPETAPVVRYIFDLCVSGKGPAQIAKQLKKDKIPTPGYSYYQKHGVELTGVDITQPYNWSTNTVAGILEDETYLGHTINLKSTTLSFKNKKRIERPESEQLRFENTHEALISRQTWEIVQDIRKHKRRRANMAEQNIFSGLVYCLDCSGTMVLHRAHTMDAVKNNFMCSTYKKKGKEVCSGHYIREQELSAILLDDIRRVTHFARQNELRFAEHIRKKQGKEAQQEIAVLRKKIDTMQKRQAELTKLFKRLYEDSVLGRIPDEQYRILSQEYTTEQKEIQEQLPAMEVRLQELKDSSTNIARFIENAKRYKEIPELTAEILRIFIKRVEVGERAEKYSRTAPQEVRIYYRDIGLVDELPQSMADSMAEEIPNEVA